MPDPQPRYAQQFLERLLGMLSPRSASAEVIKADEGTRTITGEEDVVQFRAIVEQMIQQAIQQGPQGQSEATPRWRQDTPRQEPEPPPANETQQAKEDRLNQDAAWEDIDQEYEQERGYPPEDTRYWHDELRREVERRKQVGDAPVGSPDDLPEESEIDKLHQESRILAKLLTEYRPENPGQDQSYQALIDFWDETVQQHKRALENYKTRYPTRYDKEQQSTRGEISTPTERGYTSERAYRRN